jgi:fumarate hydratase, class II
MITIRLTENQDKRVQGGKAMKERIERDALGAVKIPDRAYWGKETQRALGVFQVSGEPMPAPIIRAVARIKRHAALVNAELKLLSPKKARAIARAAQEVESGKFDGHFLIDLYQSGSGTNSHGNVNEVIANRASELLSGKRGDPARRGVHPNDDVNRGQSSNDVMPTALHLAAAEAIRRDLLPALELLTRELSRKAKAFDKIVKTGRTHLMDAAPIRLGQEFSGFAARLALAKDNVKAAARNLDALPLGGTAVGTGLNAHPKFAGKVIARLRKESGLPLIEAPNHFETQAGSDRLVRVSGSLRDLAVTLSGVAENIRWLSSGPGSGIGEIVLPELMAGSSIMPGKVNPVVPEAVIMACTRVIGNDAAAAVAGLNARFELSTMMPLLAKCLLESISLLANSAWIFTEHCVAGLKADRERCARLAGRNPMLATALTPLIGYDRAAEIAKRALKEGRTVAEVAAKMTEISVPELERILDPAKIT